MEKVASGVNNSESQLNRHEIPNENSMLSERV